MLKNAEDAKILWDTYSQVPCEKDGDDAEDAMDRQLQASMIKRDKTDTHSSNGSLAPRPSTPHQTRRL